MPTQKVRRITMSAIVRSPGDPELHVPVGRLAHDVAGEHQARADHARVQEAQQLLAIDRVLGIQGDRESEPRRLGLVVWPGAGSGP